MLIGCTRKTASVTRQQSRFYWRCPWNLEQLGAEHSKRSVHWLGQNSITWKIWKAKIHRSFDCMVPKWSKMFHSPKKAKARIHDVSDKRGTATSWHPNSAFATFVRSELAYPVFLWLYFDFGINTWLISSSPDFCEIYHYQLLAATQ